MHIIANDVAGCRSRELSVQSLSVTVRIPGLRKIIEKWILPRRCHAAFRVAAFESLLALGEKDLQQRREKAFDKLEAGEVARIFAPLVASMGNDGTMFSWMEATDYVIKASINEDIRQGLDSAPTARVTFASPTNMINDDGDGAANEKTNSEALRSLDLGGEGERRGMSGGFKRKSGGGGGASELMNVFAPPGTEF